MTRKVDKHGLQMYGLRQACSDLKVLRSLSFGFCEVFYDVNTCAVWTELQVSRDDRTAYDSRYVLLVLRAFRPLSMQVISDSIKRAVDHHKKEVMIDA